MQTIRAQPSRLPMGLTRRRTGRPPEAACPVRPNASCTACVSPVGLQVGRHRRVVPIGKIGDEIEQGSVRRTEKGRKGNRFCLPPSSFRLPPLRLMPSGVWTLPTMWLAASCRRRPSAKALMSRAAASRNAGGQFSSAGSGHRAAEITARQAANGHRAHQIWSVLICPCRIDFSRRAWAEIRAIGRSTSIRRLGNSCTKSPIPSFREGLALSLDKIHKLMNRFP